MPAMLRSLLLLSCSMAMAIAMPALAAPRAAPIEAIRSALRANDVEAATAAAERAVAALPTSADAWYFAANAYGGMAQQASVFSKLSWAKQCREAYEKAVALDPRHIDARIGLMQFYLMAPGIAGGGRDKADAAVTALAAIDAGWGHAARAMLAQADKDQPAYEREMRAAIAAAPTEPRHRIGFATMYALKQRWTEAFALIDAGLTLMPGDARLNYQIGKFAALSGTRLQGGLDALAAAQAAPVKADDYSEGALLWRRAQILEKLGRKDEALAGYRRALQQEPTLKPLVDQDIERVRKP